jgi:hypothetical protein
MIYVQLYLIAGGLLVLETLHAPMLAALVRSGSHHVVAILIGVVVLWLFWPWFLARALMSIAKK